MMSNQRLHFKGIKCICNASLKQEIKEKKQTDLPNKVRSQRSLVFCSLVNTKSLSSERTWNTRTSMLVNLYYNSSKNNTFKSI